jgi:GNAT superfamily N-acetyltransferase
VAPTVGPLTTACVDEAGALVAARHAVERAHCALLPAGPCDPAVAASIVAGTLRFCEGHAALDHDGRLVGFLAGFEQVPDPTTPMARYLPARASVMLVQGHAVAADVDPYPVYADLFGALAARRLDDGVVDHVVHVPILTPTVEAAWIALGFGRTSTFAVRDLDPTGRPRPAGVEVRIATPDDLDAVDRLVDEEAVFHAGSPILRPYLREQTRAAVRAELAAHLASDDHAFLVARRGRADVGVLSVEPGTGSPLYIPDGAAYVASTAVLPSERGGGVGAALADAAFDWCREHGHRGACLHFATANRTSSAFWTGIGFVPVMAHLRRRLDERILTARPAETGIS